MKKLLLTIELVPKTCWFTNVRSILTKQQWLILRNFVADKAWDTCEICGAYDKPVECHEIWNYDDKKLIQKLKGMIALCPNCHMVKHIGLAQIKNKGTQALIHFMKINGLDKKESEKYIKGAFDLWAERSKKKWKLDISILKNYGINVKEFDKN